MVELSAPVGRPVGAWTSAIIAFGLFEGAYYSEIMRAGLTSVRPGQLNAALAGGMSRLQYGIEDAREAALNMVDSIRASKEQINNYTAVICSLGPLVGLVGTVFGMILSFKELSKGGKGVEAAKVAEGISHALVITMLSAAVGVAGHCLADHTGCFSRGSTTRKPLWGWHRLFYCRPAR